MSNPLISTQPRSMADSACTLLQAQAAELSNAAAQREVPYSQIKCQQSATIHRVSSLLLGAPLERGDLLVKGHRGSLQCRACP